MEHTTDATARVIMLHGDPSEDTAPCHEKRQSAEQGRKLPFEKYWHSNRTLRIITAVSLLLLLLLIVIILPLVLTRGGETPKQASSEVNRFVPSGPACPPGWIGYEGKCYFFSDEERNWTSGQSFCASHNSSLAVIQNEPEKVFMLRYKGTPGHWIGLEKDLNQTWKWVDGTALNHDRLEVKGGGGDCAFLSSGFAISFQCHFPRHWICSHPDMYVRNMSCQSMTSQWTFCKPSLEGL